MTASVESLVRDLRELGVRTAGLLVVHSGFRSIGRVDGGPAGVVEALRRAVGAEGSLLLPTFTTDLIDPATWPTPPAESERQRLLATMPVFDAQRSVPFHMGAVATALWRTPGAVRSAHPVTSWTASGPMARALTEDHPLDDPEGADSPVGRAWKADAQVLLLGVGHDANTTLHLAESFLDMPHLRELPDRFPVVRSDGSREWRAVAKTTKCSDGFVAFEAVADAAGILRRGSVAAAQAQLMRSRDVVDVATALFRRDPVALLCGDPGCVHCPTSRRVLKGWQAA